MMRLSPFPRRIVTALLLMVASLITVTADAQTTPMPGSPDEDRGYVVSGAGSQSIHSESIHSQGIQSQSIDSKSIQSETEAIREAPVLKQVVVTARPKVSGHQAPDERSATIFSFAPGETLEVIDVLAGWYGIRDSRVNYTDVPGKPSYVVTKVYVKQSETGQRSDLALTQDDLPILDYLMIGEDKIAVDDAALTGYLKLELIDDALFNRQRSLAVDFLSTDRLIDKQGGVLALPTSSHVVTLVDNDVDNDGVEVYTHIGHIDALDQHLVHAQYWESQRYLLIDRQTGRKTQTVIDYPYLSADQTAIIAVYTNPYTANTDLEFYTVSGRTITPILFAGFKNWMPTVNPTDIFWAKDGYLYLAVIHSALFWTKDGDLNDQRQYMRIKVDL